MFLESTRLVTAYDTIHPLLHLVANILSRSFALLFVSFAHGFFSTILNWFWDSSAGCLKE